MTVLINIRPKGAREVGESNRGSKRKPFNVI